MSLLKKGTPTDNTCTPKPTLPKLFIDNWGHKTKLPLKLWWFEHILKPPVIYSAEIKAKGVCEKNKLPYMWNLIMLSVENHSFQQGIINSCEVLQLMQTNSLITGCCH